ncbi:MAG: amidohydrolase [bacterium]|nr:amidohydrolase [bacterium]
MTTTSVVLPDFADPVAVRRHLHRFPELSLQERQTAALIAERLRTLGLRVREGVGGTGVLGVLEGGRPGPTTLLRADMDGLPVRELNDVAYSSANEGVMHACGHDAHMSVLLGAAAELTARRAEAPGTIVFCFQPGEEGAAGNRLMIHDGALENPHVDRCFALHVYSGLDVGKIGVRNGPFFASADEFQLTIEGKGGHGAMPQLSVDPVVVAAQFITALQTIVSREVHPKDPAVITVGHIEAGSTFNVIPDRAVLQATVRNFDRETRERMPERIERVAKGVCEAMRARYQLEYRFSYPATVNDPAMTDVVREIGAQVVGKANVVEHDVVLWSEDMSFMQEERPGSYFLLGVRGGPETAVPHHNARFNLDERALQTGIQMMVALGLRG